MRENGLALSQPRRPSSGLHRDDQVAGDRLVDAVLERRVVVAHRRGRGASSSVDELVALQHLRVPRQADRRARLHRADPAVERGVEQLLGSAGRARPGFGPARVLHAVGQVGDHRVEHGLAVVLAGLGRVVVHEPDALHVVGLVLVLVAGEHDLEPAADDLAVAPQRHRVDLVLVPLVLQPGDEERVVRVVRGAVDLDAVDVEAVHEALVQRRAAPAHRVEDAEPPPGPVGRVRPTPRA